MVYYIVEIYFFDNREDYKGIDMKKKLIAWAMSIVLASGSIGAVPAFAAESTAGEIAVAANESIEDSQEDAEEVEAGEAGLTVEDVSEDEDVSAEEGSVESAEAEPQEDEEGSAEAELAAQNEEPSETETDTDRSEINDSTIVDTADDAIVTDEPIDRADQNAVIEDVPESGENKVKMGAVIEGPISYLDENGEVQTTSEYNLLTAETTTLSGIVVAASGEEPEINDRLEVEDGAMLILSDNSRVTVHGGIHLPEGKSLTITAQSTDSVEGKLIIDSVKNNRAGIGGNKGESAGSVTINGGLISSTGGMDSAGIGGGNNGAGGHVTINGGETESCSGSYAAGIGGGLNGESGTIEINGGKVEAYGENLAHPGLGGAGIGSGTGILGTSGTITINGGTITASGGKDGAGIGGGTSAEDSNESDGGTIIINGGTITAFGNGLGAGIGSGGTSAEGIYSCDGGIININGGTITANGGSDGGAGIGGGGTGVTGAMGGDAGSITINGGTVTANGKGKASGIGGGGYINDAFYVGKAGDIKITGGRITANCEIEGCGIGGSDGTVDMHLENEDGFIISSGFRLYELAITEGYYLKDAETRLVYSGEIEDPSIFNGVKLLAVTKPVHKIIVEPPQNGSISGPEICEEGDKITLAVTPKASYELMSFIVNGEDKTDEVDRGVCILTMPDSDVTVSATFETPWHQLQEKFKDGGKIVLDRDYKDMMNEGCLEVSEGAKIELDLNGFTIDRNLNDGAQDDGEYDIDGSVITVMGELKIVDSKRSGKITGGCACFGGGIYIERGTLYLENVSITGNRAESGGGVFVDGGMFTMEAGAVIHHNVAVKNGGGVYMENYNFTDRFFAMEKGSSIEYNTAYENGGGVFNESGFLQISKGASISNNTASGLSKGTGNGGGLFLDKDSPYSGSCRIGDGAEIRSNRAAGSGGGVFVSGQFTMTGGSIISNSAWGKNGGGVFVSDGGVFSLAGGRVTENAAGEKGGGVFLDSGYARLRLSNNPVIDSNTLSEDGSTNNVYLPYDMVLTIFGNLTNGAHVGVTMETPGEFTEFLDQYGNATYFKSDDNGYRVLLNNAGEAMLSERATARVNGVTGSFNDRIKLNYYFDIPDEVFEDEDAYVTITDEDRSSDKTITLPIREAEFVRGKGYKFSIPLSAKEACDRIVAKMFYGNGDSITVIGDFSRSDYTDSGVEYTLMRYFDWLEDNGTAGEQRIGAAARDYCSAAQLYFNYNADGVSVSSDVTGLDAAELSGFVAGRAGKLPDGVSIKGISAMLESDNTLRLYLSFKDNVDPTKLAYAIGGESVKLKQRSDGAYYLAMDAGVYSNHLQDTRIYSVSGGGKTYSITASVLTYARSCVFKDNATDEEINLGKALYLYNQAAVEVFGK